MTDASLDEYGYPTVAALERLLDWPHEDVNGALDFMAALWHWEDMCHSELTAHEGYVVHAEPTDRFLRCATGGWSGNEDLISAFEGDDIEHDDHERWNNARMRMRVWRMSTSGGLHIYRYLKTV